MCDGETDVVSTADESGMVDLAKQTNKRRSIIFQRRSLNNKQGDIVNKSLDESEINNEQLCTQEKSKGEENFNLSAYIVSLRNEREEWRKTLNERKSRRRRLAKQEINLHDECQLDLTVLSNSQRSFCLSRPNYHEITQNVNSLVPLAVKVATLNSHINDLNEHFLESMAEKLVESTRRITKIIKE